MTAVAAAVAAYLLLWPVVRPMDPEAPVLFFVNGSAGRVGLLAIGAFVLAAVCCLTTFSARSHGTVAAVLVGLGGVSLRSGPLREMLWLKDQDLPGMYWRMVLEVLLLAVVAVLAAGVVRVVRPLVARILPRWRWEDLLASLTEAEQRDFLRAMTEDGKGGQARQTGLIGGGFGSLIVEDLALASDRKQGRRVPAGEVTVRYALCFLACLLIGVGLVWLLARSTDRGKILFAVFGGCFLATLIAYQVFPTRWTPAAWAAPVAIAVAYYVLAAVAPPSSTPGAWMYVRPCYQALPIDWMTAGLGGSLAGYWVSQRVHEAKFLEWAEEQDQSEGA